MLLRARLAQLGCRPGGWRSLSSVPRVGELRTAREVVEAHALHGHRYGPMKLSASWSTLGKLVRQLTLTLTSCVPDPNPNFN